MSRTPEDTPTDPDALIRVGIVASVDLESGTCTVTLDEDDGAETHGIRWLHPRMGTTQAWLPPSVGEQVLVLCPGGEIGAAIAIGGIHSNAFPPPIDEATPLLRFADGATLSYDPQAHELLMQLPSGATTVLISDGGVDIVGNVAIEGDVTVSGTLTASTDVIGGGKSLKTHTHPANGAPPS